MKFSTTFALALVSSIKLALADSAVFDAQTLRTGTDLQFQTVVAANGALSIGKDGAQDSVVTDAGAWKFGDQYVKIQADGTLGLVADAGSATTGFYIKDGYLSYPDGYYAVKGAQGYSLHAGKTSDASVVPFAIRPLAKGASSAVVVPDFAAGAPAPAPAPAKTPAQPISQIGDGQIQATTKTPIQPVTQINDGQIQATTQTPVPTFVPQTVNGAGRVAVGAAGLLAAGALLL